MEFVVVLAISLIKVLFINFLKIVEIVRALGIHTFVKDEMLTVFLVNERVETVRTL